MTAYNVTATIITNEPPEHPDSITDHRTFGPFEDRAEAERTVTALASRENVIEAKLWEEPTVSRAQINEAIEDLGGLISESGGQRYEALQTIKAAVKF